AVCKSMLNKRLKPVAASTGKALREDAEEPEALTSEQVEEMIKHFGDAARRAMESGFDGVEIHGANTYLIQQFFSPHSNRREDQWGGSREKRFKFINDLVDAVTDTVDNSNVNDFIVGYRFSPEEFETPGLRLDDTFYLIDQLCHKPLDYLHISFDDYQR